MPIAELNIGRLLAPVEDPRIDGFRNALDAINALAERSPGFIWRMTGDGSNNATDIKLGGDPLAISNLSLWRDVQSLEQFVFGTVHAKFYRRRDEWFESPVKMHFVMWEVAEGHIPSLEEALDRLAYLEAHGDSDHAFGWAYLRETKLWREQRCQPVAAE